MNWEDSILTERLPRTLGGRAIARYHSFKPGRLDNPRPPVSGYIAHYDPSDLDTVTFDADSFAITALADKVGSFDSTAVNGAHLFSPPTILNDRAAIYFDGGAIDIRTDVSMSDTTSSFFGVVSPASFSSDRCMLGPSADGGIEILGNDSDTKLYVSAADVANRAVFDGTLLSPGPQVWGAVMDSGTGNITLYINQNSETDSATVSFSAGRTMVIGRAPTVTGDTHRFTGFIGEILCYDTALSSGDALATTGYLMSKWGIS